MNLVLVFFVLSCKLFWRNVIFAYIALCHSISGQVLKALASAHYEGGHNPPMKAFDYYAATALACFLRHEKESNILPHSGMMTERNARRLFFCEEYGLTFISMDHTWDATLERYISQIDTAVHPSDDQFTKTKKEYFLKEIHIMKTIPFLPSLKVMVGGQ